MMFTIVREVEHAWGGHFSSTVDTYIGAQSGASTYAALLAEDHAERIDVDVFYSAGGAQFTTSNGSRVSYTAVVTGD